MFCFWVAIIGARLDLLPLNVSIIPSLSGRWSSDSWGAIRTETASGAPRLVKPHRKPSSLNQYDEQRLEPMPRQGRVKGIT